MLEVWVARMLRASGAMLMCATAFFFFRDLAIARGAQPHGLATEVVVSGIALACLVFSWLFPRPWRLLLFASYCLLVLNFALSVVATHNLVIFFAVLCLVEVGAAALTPWEDFWQAGLNLVCLLAWVITAQIVPHAGLDVVDMSASLLAAAAIGQFTVRIRQQFTADNLAAGYKFRDSEARLRKILNASPEIISITRDNQVQHKLAESPATLGMIFDASTDSMIVSDVNTGLVIEINREFSRLTGYTREDAVGRDIRDLRLWNDRGKAAEFARNLHATNEVRNIEDLVRTKSGALVACLMSGALIDFGGRPCCLATTRDVTELERTRRRLEES
jgi:PAS domain S-box-containing protein